MNKKIEDLIIEYVKNYKTLKQTETDWREPVIGFADAGDQLFSRLKEIIGPNHALPTDIVPKCLKKCVNDAFLLQQSEVFYDRKKCNEQIYEKIIPEYSIGLGDTCGKCMCGLPCSLVIPKKNEN